MAWSANGNNFTNKDLSRVKYDLEYDSSGDLYRFKGKPPEIIIEANDAAVDVFFDTSNNNEQEWFDSSTLDYNQGNQIFFDVNLNKNLTVLSLEIGEECLDAMNGFVNNPI